MAESLGDAVLTLRTDDSALDSGIKRAHGKAQKLADDFTSIGNKTKDIGAKLSLGLTLPLGAFAVAAGSAASDAQELQSAFDQTFGAMSDSMNEWARKTGDAMGRSTQEMQKAANTFGIFFNQAAPTKKAAADLSQQFSVLAQDLSSFFNVDPGEAIAKLRSGLSGESEPLRDFGVFLTEAAVKAKAMEMGLGGANKELSEQEKILVRAAIIMDQTKSAQGDVARTASSTANQVRAANAAWDELQVTIGTKLLPVVTPLIAKAAELLNWVTGLPEPVLTGAAAVTALAMAVGPLMMGIGGLASVAGAAIPAITSVVGLLGAGGMGAALAGIAAAAAPVVAIVAALVATWMAFGDKVGPVLAQLVEKARAAFGPEIIALIATLKATLTELWNGPLGEGLRMVVSALGTLAAAYTEAFGSALIVVLQYALKFIVGFFQQIGDAIRIVSRLLSGDWRGAWQAAVSFVNRAFGGLPAFVARVMQQMVSGIRTWIVDRLNAVWASVAEKVEWVKKLFFGLYDAVVGHSYVPDMVDEIGRHMARLDANLVQPAATATEKVKQAFMQLQSEVAGIMNRLFPEQAAFNRFAAEQAKLQEAMDKGLISADAYAEALRRLQREYSDATFGKDEDFRPTDADELTPPASAAKDFEDFQKAVLGGIAEPAEDATERAITAFADMARGIDYSINDVVRSIKSGDFLGALGGITDIIGQIGQILSGLGAGGAGGFLSGLASSIGTTFSGFFAKGGLIPNGTFGIVGERGPEPVIGTSQGARVLPNSSLRGMGGGGGVQVEVLPSDYFDVRVTEVASPLVQRGSMMATLGGSALAQRDIERRSRRRLG